MLEDRPITWVIDEFMEDRAHPSGFPSLSQAAKDAGHEVHLTVRPADRGPFSPDLKIPENRPCVVWGTHEFVSCARKTTAFKDACPLAYCAECNLKYSVYSAYIGGEMLNSDFVMIPFAEFVRRGHQGKDWFLRPDVVTKPFAGFVIKQEDFDIEINSLRQLQRVDPEMLVIAAQAKKLHGEFRFVIADRKVVTGSEYRWDEKLDIRSDVDERCLEAVQKIAQLEWQPDRVYVCDAALVEINGEVVAKIVELNTFSCAGLYACDTTKIVAAVSNAARAEFFGLD